MDLLVILKAYLMFGMAMQAIFLVIFIKRCTITRITIKAKAPKKSKKIVKEIETDFMEEKENENGEEITSDE